MRKNGKKSLGEKSKGGRYIIQESGFPYAIFEATGRKGRGRKQTKTRGCQGYHRQGSKGNGKYLASVGVSAKSSGLLEEEKS